jgi:ribonucleoside-diphosphate reductase alpha chain
MTQDIAADELTLPIKRTDGDTIEERLTDNAYYNILPARYLRKDADGEVVEDQADLFERVGKNIALAEAVFESRNQDIDITVTPDQLKPDHPRRDKLAEEVFGKGTRADDDVETTLTEYNVNKFAYDTVVPDLPDSVRTHVESVATEFEESMADLSFMPNSPTLMNAGDELQQLSACFVDSPEDDIDDIHQTAKEAAQVFQSGGGMGYAFWRLRPYGDAVGSTGGIASGPITFMRTYDQMCETIAQGGARRGAQMGVMRVSHPDVIQFIHAKNKDVSLANTLRLNDPDDFTHTSFAEALEEARDLIDDEGRVPEHLRNAVEGHLSNFNISVGITDRFMDAVKNDEEYTFTNPRTEEPHIATAETKELYDMFGLGEHVEVGEVLSVPAREVWDRIVEGAHENGEPGVIYLERVNKEHSFDVEEHPDHQILATNPCVTGDTLVSTENGLVPAEELYEQGVARDIVVDGRLSEERVKEASSVYKTGEKDVHELTTQEGYELRLTADHRVMTDEGWTEARHLEPGDSVHIQNRKGEFGQHGSPEEGRVLGWLVGDGHLKHGEERAVLNFYDEDAQVSEGLAEDVNEVVREPLGNANYEIGVNSITRDDSYRGAQAVEQRVRSARLYEYADEIGLTADKLQVPDTVLRGSEEMARGFLQSLFSADGSVQGNVEKGVSVRLWSSDADLLGDVQQLLLNFGIASKVYENRKEAGTRELSDGNGGTKAYETKEQHELVIVKDNLERFAEEVGFLLDYKSETLEQRLSEYDRGPYSERFQATVDSVEADGHEAVYDLTEPETNSFVANGVVVHNCGEQPLEEYEACNLGHINLSTLAAEDAPDWRVWSEAHASEFDTEAEAISAFLEEAVDFAEFDRRIEMGTRFLENVVTMSDFPVDKIEQKVREMRKIGLGIMGLAQLYIQLGVKYGSDTANEIARQLMTHINHHSKRTSHDLAAERGTFAEWDNSKYADPTSYREWFERQTGLSADDWEDGFPIRNHNTTTIAPTGTTSMVGNTTGGCEPIYNVAYYKNVSDDVQGDEMLVEFDDYFLRVLEDNDIEVEAVKEEAQEQMATNQFDGVTGLETVPDAVGELFVTTGDLSAKDHAGVQTACQEGVDSAISKTVNAPNDSTVEDAKEVFEYIYENGGKGVTYYRDGTRSKQVLTREPRTPSSPTRTRLSRLSSSRFTNSSAVSRTSSRTRRSVPNSMQTSATSSRLTHGTRKRSHGLTNSTASPSASTPATGNSTSLSTRTRAPANRSNCSPTRATPVGSPTPLPTRSRRPSRSRSGRESTRTKSSTNSRESARRKSPGTKVSRLTPSPTLSGLRSAATSTTR